MGRGDAPSTHVGPAPEVSRYRRAEATGTSARCAPGAANWLRAPPQCTVRIQSSRSPQEPGRLRRLSSVCVPAPPPWPRIRFLCPPISSLLSVTPTKKSKDKHGAETKSEISTVFSGLDLQNSLAPRRTRDALFFPSWNPGYKRPKQTSSASQGPPLHLFPVLAPDPPSATPSRPAHQPARIAHAAAPERAFVTTIP